MLKLGWQRAKKCVDEKTIKELYYVHSYIIYCHKVWGGTYSTDLKPLIIQKRSFSIIAGVPRRHNFLELFQYYNIVPFDKLYEYSQYVFIYKLINHIFTPNVFKHISWSLTKSMIIILRGLRRLYFVSGGSK